jgi:hypothetical protein
MGQKIERGADVTRCAHPACAGRASIIAWISVTNSPASTSTRPRPELAPDLSAE